MKSLIPQLCWGEWSKQERVRYDCEKKFTYYANGKIDGDDYTIGLLNLNDYELRNARKSVVRGLQGLDKETVQMIYMDETQEEHPPYYNVIKWYWETL